MCGYTVIHIIVYAHTHTHTHTHTHGHTVMHIIAYTRMRALTLRLPQHFDTPVTGPAGEFGSF